MSPGRCCSHPQAIAEPVWGEGRNVCGTAKKTHPVGLSDTALDTIVRCYVGQACPTDLSDITASINWSNTPVRAVLDPPCSTSDRTGVSDRLGKASVGHAGPITGQTRRFDRCSTRPVRPVNAGRVPALTGQTRPFEHRSNRRVRPVIGPACPTGSEEHRSNPAKPITGRT
ncbi:hypothetical protein PCANC_06400 [Puccinia coronata f. sp. avenae]|uniref:Uncharacterized protein n=1 Tax=Puccinia coronata f. sp. avenae TaxID=200324 RepID=A0A2N5VVV1_9BASI|nr:hypothetical protein PCANC_06400 [Puccinia coronata f. sp. avenae]